MKKTNISHIEINVSDYAKSIRFYDLTLQPLGWERLVCTTSHTSYCDGHVKIILSPVESRFKKDGFHRKRIGLNHLAFDVDNKDDVHDYYKNVLLKNNIDSLYQDGPGGDNDYFSVLFEDPDRIKLEIVYAPKYLEKECWPNNIESDFDPYN